MKNIFIIIISCLCIQLIQSQKPYQFAIDKVNKDSLFAHLNYLASDKLEGRETGKFGNELAANYISSYFRYLGLKPIKDNSYLNEVNFNTQYWEDITINSNEKKWRNLWNFYADPFSNKNYNVNNLKNAQFLGYGIKNDKQDDFQKLKKGNKVVFFLDSINLNNNKSWDLNEKGNSHIAKV